MNVQSLERTFIDKVFAICDYQIQNMKDRYSRHLYDICKLLGQVKSDQQLYDVTRNNIIWTNFSLFILKSVRDCVVKASHAFSFTFEKGLIIYFTSEILFNPVFENIKSSYVIFTDFKQRELPFVD